VVIIFLSLSRRQQMKRPISGKNGNSMIAPSPWIERADGAGKHRRSIHKNELLRELLVVYLLDRGSSRKNGEPQGVSNVLCEWNGEDCADQWGAALL
jgi:hypothetical protein